MITSISRKATPSKLGFLAAGLLLSSLAYGQAPEPEEKRLRDEVTLLASPAFQGRSDVGARKTVAHLIKTFQTLKLEPLFGGSYIQDVPTGNSGWLPGRNVGARIVGSDPELRDEWVIVSAHYDHLGVRNGVLYPGADDNASGVAMMLEVARSIVEGPVKPKRSLMFVGFDLEEIGLYGSRYFVEHPPVPLQRIALFITADMIGRSLGGVCEPYVFVMGSENAPGLRPLLNESVAGRSLKLGVVGSDLLVLDRSDYGPFRSRSVPYLFFSTGENPRYHSPEDTAETINYPKLEAISRTILGVVRRACDAPALPKWSSQPEADDTEPQTIRDVLHLLLENREQLKLGTTQTIMINRAIRSSEAIIARGKMTPAERVGLINLVRVILVSVL
ncbi:M28 family metallopeptidase [Singulisphaera sp. PoT]|uniref:M28 family metallopeptidase n=1 Tax=Singulisphaera sp. PoT TaxID=3411797 RepID=UPI003BF536BD